uniref:NADP-dependent oxidoreductase domain-containing protein n=1 Tax=Chromera velia CCMP2878 TaxID=1169474 RepID=A0A0G4HTI7_9ALVE|mmetsp:Transcript_12098/g.23359  ORF Transcript_12098/g.23359 Transcript_12098/m.23359 type:complete len:419 (-) Transcript_12098:170-1426(-)|eukprot:Cvel_31440.t1-p1 / transcript=Cvel_31440.t1 / gene=Cvel_31440 / organism=Chromera_velia_CCMP2878 / gene_product=Uncharacterized oxidoreductase At1g06690,, putative / transcript_product=Uncharacterized oxidoreductase At1g06690,, putative / location=Cvel_scaffold4688:3154-6346(-) / protein_length=418 / sequence_SO=supercontig / SO=protein_coding / is_pseudo=false
MPRWVLFFLFVISRCVAFRGRAYSADRNFPLSSTRANASSWLGTVSSLSPKDARRKEESPLTFAQRMLGTQRVDCGVGCLSWGDPRRGFGERRGEKKVTFDKEDIKMASNILVSNGVSFFDTAEVYGYQSIKKKQGSEHLVGAEFRRVYREAVREGRKVPPPLSVGTKFFPVPWTNLLGVGGFPRGGRKAVKAALRRSLSRLGFPKVSVYQLHFAFPYWGGYEALFDGLGDCLDEGMCDSLGVCNFDRKQIEEVAFKGLVEQRGLPLISNQVQVNLLSLERLLDGTVGFCRSHSIVPIAHSPLATGLLANGAASKVRRKKDPAFREFCETMDAVGRSVDQRLRQNGEGANGNTPTSHVQLAINWLRHQGCVPIPGVSNANHAMEVARSLQWRMTADEAEELKKGALKLRPPKSLRNSR